MKDLNPTLLPAALAISENFHQNVKLSWKTLNDYIQQGKVWIDSIKSTYSDDKLISYAYTIYNAELAHFANNNGLLSVEEIYRALVMKGGGIKGLAYVGALEVIEEYYDFNWYAGTSAGAIAAVLLASGHTNQELMNILSTKNFNDFKDANFFKSIINLASKKGLYEAESFVNWLSDILTAKLDFSVPVRLSDLPFRTTLFASIRNKSALVFDSKSPVSKDTDAAFAARCSMSIPIFFAPQKSEGQNIYDGGMQNNFPIKKLIQENPNLNFVGLYLGEEIYKRKKSTFLGDMVNILTEATDHEILREFKDDIIIINPFPISTFSFKLNKDEKEFLLEGGRLSALRFLHKKNIVDINDASFSYTIRKETHETNRKKLTKKYYIKSLWVFALCVVIVFELIYFQDIYHILTYMYERLHCFFIH